MSPKSRITSINSVSPLAKTPSSLDINIKGRSSIFLLFWSKIIVHAELLSIELGPFLIGNNIKTAL
jgi:hypothetical protein